MSQAINWVITVSSFEYMFPQSSCKVCGLLAGFLLLLWDGPRDVVIHIFNFLNPVRLVAFPLMRANNKMFIRMFALSSFLCLRSEFVGFIRFACHFLNILNIPKYFLINSIHNTTSLQIFRDLALPKVFFSNFSKSKCKKKKKIEKINLHSAPFFEKNIYIMSNLFFPPKSMSNKTKISFAFSVPLETFGTNVFDMKYFLINEIIDTTCLLIFRFLALLKEL